MISRVLFLCNLVVLILILGLAIAQNGGNRPPEEIIWEKDGAKMVLIDAGEFQMGSSDGYSHESPVHTVSLDAFYMDVYEVTVGQYKRFIEATGYRVPDWNGVAKYSPTDQHPMIYVSWHDAATYAQWAGKRLPTEAEWEKAARGGLDGKRYPLGDEISHDNANYYGGASERDQWSRTSPVGSFPPNGYGLYDMAGNVLEWCMDEYQSGFYASSPRNNPVAGGIISFVNNKFTNVILFRVVRGGSWSSNPYFLRVAYRDSYLPTLSYHIIGFRCAGLVTP